MLILRATGRHDIPLLSPQRQQESSPANETSLLYASLCTGTVCRPEKKMRRPCIRATCVCLHMCNMFFLIWGRTLLGHRRHIAHKRSLCKRILKLLAHGLCRCMRNTSNVVSTTWAVCVMLVCFVRRVLSHWSQNVRIHAVWVFAGVIVQ